MRTFLDRRDAGRQLAGRLSALADADSVVLALPRGGVPVAHEIASRLGASMDVLLVRKLGVPWQPELAFGAVSTGGVTVLNDEVMRAAGLGREEIDAVIDRERAELERRERLYRGERAPVDVSGRTVVLVDDGIATGSTVRAALRALSARGAARTIVAAPVAAPETVEALRREADDVVCVETPPDLVAIGFWYRDFSPVADEEVLEILESGLTGGGG